MIIYFSGTGNSEYVAKRTGHLIEDEVINLFDRIRGHDFSDLSSDRPWVVVAPTYSWRIPRIVEGWLRRTKLTGNKQIYFILTCGGSIGNAGKYLKILCEEKGMRYMGCQEIVMPENYIAMFGTPSKEEALRIIQDAEGIIEETAASIKNGAAFLEPKRGIVDKISSTVINPVFYPVFVHSKKFYALDSCISCGKCVTQCPLSNIRLEKGKPVWGDNCTHCMACICRCPKEAIEYGKKSKGKARYICPK